MVQYCFDINNPNNVEIDSEALIKHMTNVYAKKAFSDLKKSELPFTIIYVETDNNICINITGVKNTAKVVEANEKLKKVKLPAKFKGVTLSNPHEFTIEQNVWWGKEGEKKKAGKKAGKKGDKKGEKKGKEIMWTSIVQKGPYFKDLMEPYEPVGASLKYEGKSYKLKPEEEKIASFYAKRIITEKKTTPFMFTKDPVFNKNFWEDFKTYLSPVHQKVFKDFSKIKWNDLVSKIEKKTAKELASVDIKAKKAKLETLKRQYGFVILDGHREKVGGFVIEPASIFLGRVEKGNAGNPTRGRIKKGVYPEDVTLNLGKNDPIPPAPIGLNGKKHKWGGITHDRTSTWLARFKTINGIKYIRFSSEGRFKGQSDFKKYEKARKLNYHIEKIRKRYLADVESKNMKQRQLGTVLYLIDNYGIRVGNEKGKEEADTVGASTLRVEHVKLKSPNKIILDYPGKDCVRCKMEIKVSSEIYKNFADMIKGKKDKVNVFDQISSGDINEYLQQFDKDFTAKVFRTRLASSIMVKELKKLKLPKDVTKAQAKALFNQANVVVAKALNHVKTVTRAVEESEKKLRARIKELKKKRKDLKKEGKKLTQVDKSIKTAEEKLQSDQNIKGIAIGTSFDNYIDPRLMVAWAKKQGIPPEYIISPESKFKKFKWAVDTTDKKWDYLKSTLIDGEDLEPANKEAKKGITKPKKKPAKTKTATKSSKKSSKKSAKKEGKKKLKNEIKEFKGRPQKVIALGENISELQQYKFLLNFCKTLTKSFQTKSKTDIAEAKQSVLNLNKVNKDIMKWMYKQCLENVKTAKGTRLFVNKQFIKIYKRLHG